MLPLFEGGLRKAELQRSWSVLAQAGDNYRAVVLTAFQQVEDGLALTTQLSTEAAQQQGCPAGGGVKAQNMTLALYTGGLDNYLDVTVSQVYALTAEIAEVQVQDPSHAGGGGSDRCTRRRLEQRRPAHSGPDPAVQSAQSAQQSRATCTNPPGGG